MHTRPPRYDTASVLPPWPPLTTTSCSLSATQLKCRCARPSPLAHHTDNHRPRSVSRRFKSIVCHTPVPPQHLSCVAHNDTVTHLKVQCGPRCDTGLSIEWCSCSWSRNASAGAMRGVGWHAIGSLMIELRTRLFHALRTYLLIH